MPAKQPGFWSPVRHACFLSHRFHHYVVLLIDTTSQGGYRVLLRGAAILVTMVTTERTCLNGTRHGERSAGAVRWPIVEAKGEVKDRGQCLNDRVNVSI